MRTHPKAVLSLVPLQPDASPSDPERGNAADGSPAPERTGSGAEHAATGGAEPPANDVERKELRRARLAVLRAMLENGEYPVDLDRLATRIVEEDEKARSGRP